MDGALLTGIGGLIGAVVGAGALWRAWQADRQGLVRTNIESLWAENRALRSELDTERKQRGDGENRMREALATVERKLDRCEAEKDEMRRELADLRAGGR